MREGRSSPTRGGIWSGRRAQRRTGAAGSRERVRCVRIVLQIDSGTPLRGSTRPAVARPSFARCTPRLRASRSRYSSPSARWSAVSVPTGAIWAPRSVAQMSSRAECCARQDGASDRLMVPPSCVPACALSKRSDMRKCRQVPSKQPSDDSRKPQVRLNQRGATAKRGRRIGSIHASLQLGSARVSTSIGARASPGSGVLALESPDFGAEHVEVMPHPFERAAPVCAAIGDWRPVSCRRRQSDGRHQADAKYEARGSHGTIVVAGRPLRQ